MVEDAADRATEHLKDEVGDGLRTVVIVRDEGFTIHYLRDDLRRDYSRETVGKVVDSFRLQQPLFSPRVDGFPIGVRHAIVHYHQNAFVLQVPYSETEPILISVTPEVGRDLLGFIEQCPGSCSWCPGLAPCILRTHPRCLNRWATTWEVDRIPGGPHSCGTK